jgi:hypothetical protein
VRLAVDPMLARLDLADRPTIGFHVRGGDKLQEDKIGCAAAPSAPGRPAAAPACRLTRPGRRRRSNQSCAPRARRNRTTTLAHHYIAAFADEKRRLARRGHVSHPAARTRMERCAWRYEHGEAEQNPLLQSAARHASSPSPT